MTATIVQLSDTHLTAAPDGTVRDLSGDARLATVIAVAMARHPELDGVVLSGDVADDGSAAAYQRVAALVAPLAAPILAVAGNHDDPAALAAVFGPPEALAVGAWRIVAVDSSRPGRIDGEVDLADAHAALDAAYGHPTVLVLHHPPRTPSTHPWFQLVGADALLALLAEHPEVKVVVAGHLHEAFERALPGGATLLAAPSTLYAIEHDGDDWSPTATGPTGARVLHLHDDGTWEHELVVA